MRTTSKGLRVAPHQLKFLRKIQKLFQGAAETLSPPCRHCALSQAMTIHRLLKQTTFGPEEVERLVAAYELTLRTLDLKDRSDPITQLVAEKIIAVGRLGIEDPAEISKLALNELRS